VQVPDATIARLPVYLRCLIQAQSRRMPVVNSRELAEMAGTNAAQVRKDLSYLGEFGTRGIGYDVDSLIAQLSRALGLTRSRNVAIVGFGRLGGALVGYGGFQDRGFSVAAVFDSDPEKVGTEVGHVSVSPMSAIEDVVRERDIEIGVIATPAGAAQEVADRLAAAGVTSVLNFAPVRLETPEGVFVRQVDLASELQILSFHLAERDEEATDLADALKDVTLAEGPE
jgi:redox-sensing transcriptional repressor